MSLTADAYNRLAVPANEKDFSSADRSRYDAAFMAVAARNVNYRPRYRPVPGRVTASVWNAIYRLAVPWPSGIFLVPPYARPIVKRRMALPRQTRGLYLREDVIMATQQQTETQQTAAQRRRARLVARLAMVRHWLWGALAVEPVPGTVFRPHQFFADPARLRDCLFYWRMRARRDGCGAGLSPRLREAALDQAAQNCLTWFLDLDYRRLGITADEFARAILTAYKRCRRAMWEDRTGDRDAARFRRQEVNRGSFRLYNRAQASRTPDPRRIVHAADALGMDATAVDGRGICDEAPGGLVTIPGGPSGRGETDGRMRLVTIRDVAVNIPATETEARQEVNIITTRWRMIRGRGKARRLPSCTVREGSPAPRPTFKPSAPPAAGIPQPEGIINARPPLQPLPPVTPEDAAFNRGQLAFALAYQPDPTPPAYMVWRARRAAALRAKRAAARA